MRIYIVPLQFNDAALIRDVADVLEKLFQVSVAVIPHDFPVDKGRDPIRNQVNSSWALSELIQIAPNNDGKILGITEHDLYTSIFTYVFGEAELDGRVAVVSTHRFRDEFYGLPQSRENLRNRLIRESVHELGHTYGLKHCDDLDCVMRPSSYVEEIDFKSYNFCDKCYMYLNL